MGPKIEPCGTPQGIFVLLIKLLLILTLAFDHICFRDDSSKQPYGMCLANKSLCGKQSKALDKSVNSAPQIFFYQDISSTSQLLIVKNVGDCDPLCRHIGILKVLVQNIQTLNLSYTLDITGNRLTGLKIVLLVLELQAKYRLNFSILCVL